MIGSEKLIVSGNSWFSTKTIEVVCFLFQIFFVKQLINVREILLISPKLVKLRINFIFVENKRTLDAKAQCREGKNPDH
jgi:hypothetical protein